VANGFSARSALESLASHVLHVHAKDAVRDLAQGRGMEVPLGRGSVDFPELIGTLEEREYRGYYVIERDRSDDPVYEIGQAVKYLKSLG
jgi:sugar phosphate isomerase/epimerase